ncbi:MAG: CRTAC1 family protein [Thermodesulfobacteriota bacterium]
MKILNSLKICVILIAIVFVLSSCDSGSNGDNALPIFNESNEDLLEMEDLGFLGQSAIFLDYDGDNDQDLLFTTIDIRKRDIFFFENRDSKFYFLPGNRKISNELVRSLTVADCDNDNDLDLALGTIESQQPFILYKNNENNFVASSEESGITEPGTVLHVIWGDFNSDGNIDIFQGNMGKNLLYINSGDCVFNSIDFVTGQESIRTNSINATDIDNDNDPDLILANNSRNQLLRNDGNNVFVDISETAGIQGREKSSSKAVCSGDYNNDGFLDLYIVNSDRIGNKLYKNNGDATFTDVTDSAGAKDVGDGRTCSFLDFDGDGLLDIFSTNHLSPNKMYKNLGNGKFEDVAKEIGLTEPLDIFSATWGDYNNDGFLDVFLNGHIGKALFKNSGNKNNSIIIKLIGNGSTTNSSAIGSKVTLNSTNGSQIREVSGGKGCCEQDMLPVHFGVGKEKNADINVQWTDGTSCGFKNVNVKNNTFVSINQADCKLVKIK